MSLQFHPEAQAEAEEAVDEYEDIDPILADDLFAAFREAEADIARTPLRYPLAEDAPGEFEVRNKVIRRFSFRLIYLMEPAGPVVLAVAHLHRRPGYWRHRLPRRSPRSGPHAGS